ncbi:MULTISPECIES: acyl-CoA synthetase [unclassified Mycolicibacterium]|uniref:acyl-CoA synthetase n=1 Tax=unclassified Mycolicibacterium TaxID=2636767 RepID=UPI0013059247|nr:MULTISPECIES: acyl-CoA synthetase [unclassified Mycolicibacterium]MUL80750.1 acyl-CoA synthetase [Mycolicibacterium sp. CBMA 329]MUL86517.1 acyl-CoA synthetase [Mycolicibacterium sp. CBMA 331]MUM01378.1 acyl-CoA synthetase [Mycolicibacterium sp. CBMA 334]MUM25888.1 acyl-CoA synthetase [Mycolicibacterium sp. CBMA 295]MUM36813.1 acyl-CoA synthetase [Mycolicibacterium sp. CBMA 247]
MQFTVPAVAEAVAAAIGDRPLVVQGDRRYTYRQILDRSNRLAAYLHSRGLGAQTERSELPGHEVGQDLLGIYAYNGPEFVESLLGSFRARVAPFNVNYRYVKNELQYLLADSGASALVYHAAFAPRVAEVLPELPALRVLIQIADDSGNELLDGAVDYESIVSDASADMTVPVAPSPDDLYVLYTGGTTGMPKGVLWRQHDIFMTAFGGRNMVTGEKAQSVDEIVGRAVENPGTTLLILPPLIHGAAQWGAMTALTTGQTVVFPSVVDRFDAEDVVRTIERERVLVATVVGDAMARPLLDAIKAGIADVSSLSVVANGGAQLTPYVKQQLIDAKANLIVIDGVGSSETGAQMSHMSAPGAVSTGTFNGGPDTCVVTEDFTAVLPAGHDGLGWLAQRGFVPLGYKGDAVKTAATFPVIDGVRYATPGDRARQLDSGAIELLGRDSATINSGGEKIFAEEVESAIASHPAVQDVVVTGRPSERWGQEVVAVVCLTEHARAGGSVEADELIRHAESSIARYKLPKAVVFRPVIERSPAGKADYRWAREQAVSETS